MLESCERKNFLIPRSKSRSNSFAPGGALSHLSHRRPTAHAVGTYINKGNQPLQGRKILSPSFPYARASATARRSVW